MTTTAPAPVRARRRRGVGRRQHVGWLFVAPFLVVFAAFLVFPLIYAFGMSLFSSTLAGGTQFVGAGNYVKAFTDPLFLGGVGRVVLYAVVMIPTQLGIALVAALLLDSLASRLAQASRLLIFAPYAIPVVIGSLMWSFLYSPRFGPGATIFGVFGLDAPDFLSSSSIFFSLVNVVTWQWAGYYMIIIYAALRSVDPSLYEAARIDGANGFQIATRIKIPIISSSMVMVITFALIGTMQFFTEPTVLRSVASGALPADYTPNMYAFALAFSYSQFNYASTIAFALAFVVFLGSFAFLFLTRKQNGLR
ncbi:carbohydrate ABC transporter permease [Microbacterium excoecariae]|uniref:carbohydrate ABC transporter permease n=1 Tax=Microbacterium excoecariae TaxID=2715210 RepID=UPI00140D70B6|nr:sugar ABC transporter permease [Microbacterium excoecariae]NHI16709.1 sugar ABC transporter permease [Microbacterium excoecariae]